MDNETGATNADTTTVQNNGSANNDGTQNTNNDGGENQGADNKSQETPEARKIRLDRQIEQHKKKHPELYEDQKKSNQTAKADDFDYGQEAFLVASGIKSEEERTLVTTMMKETGKSLKDLVSSNYFQSELKTLREDMATAKAIPGESKRTNQAAPNTVEYWLAKGELPPASESKLRQDVVNARIKKESNSGVFTSNPVVQ